jgi:hypothetical protein
MYFYVFSLMLFLLLFYFLSLSLFCFVYFTLKHFLCLYIFANFVKHDRVWILFGPGAAHRNELVVGPRPHRQCSATDVPFI